MTPRIQFTWRSTASRWPMSWASRWAGLPLRIVMDNLTKVSFPTFARLQHDEEKLGRAVEVSLKYLCMAAFPVLVGMGFFALPLVNIIPKYTKWLPALIPLYVYLYNSAWASISTSLTNLLNATGHIKQTFKLMLMWTGLTWATMPLLAIKFGYLGVSYAVLIIATSSFVTIITAKKYLNFSLLNILKTPLISTMTMSLFLFISIHLANSTISLIIIGILASVIYICSVLFVEGISFVERTVNYFKMKHV